MFLKTLRFFPFGIIILVLLFSCKKNSSLPPPSGLTITNISDTGCSISWPAVSGANSYKITLASDASFFSVVSGYNAKMVTNTAIDRIKT